MLKTKETFFVKDKRNSTSLKTEIKNLKKKKKPVLKPVQEKKIKYQWTPLLQCEKGKFKKL